PHIPVEDRDPHSRRLYYLYRMDEHRVTDAHIRTARHAYYGMVSYIDDKVGDLIRALDATGLANDTIVIFTADHGEMLGERGMWYKMTFFEWSARIPLMISAPSTIAARHVPDVVSLLDLFPTILDLASDGPVPAPIERLDGHSLVPLMKGSADG